jgi:mannose-6-phosphate isomerase-like protein (cupin superfamily)
MRRREELFLRHAGHQAIEGAEMAIRRCARNILAILMWSLMALVVSAQALAQGCRPVAERVGEQSGCWILADESLGLLPQTPLFWHLVNYSTRAEAEAAKGPHGTVFETFGKIWLSTIAEAGWRAPSGVRVAEIGPIPGISNEPYTANDSESGNTAGISTDVHRHDGPELFYTLVGELCLETPDGMTISHAGESTIAPPGIPMRLTNIGTELRRSLVLVLHETAKPRATRALDWTPKGLCKP